jgi:PAS domain S-box-containing protein
LLLPSTFVRESARILVVGGDRSARTDVVDLLAAAGFMTVEERSEAGGDAVDLVIATGDDVVALCAELRQTPQLATVPLIAVAPRDPSEIATSALAAGADDVVLLPLRGALELRVRAQLRIAADRVVARQARECEESIVEIQRILATAAGGESNETLRDLLLQAVQVMRMDRASIVLVSEASDQAYVVAATDDPTLSKFAVDLSIYPEIAGAMNAREPLLVEDAAEYPPLQPHAAALAQKGVRSCAVFPIEWRRRVAGVVLYRSAHEGASRLGPRRLAYGRIVAGLVAQQVSGGRVLESLREQTHRMSLARYESERRLRAIEQLRDFFEAASDGVVVLDGEGRILFVNRAAESITGFARDGLLGCPLTDLVPGAQRDGLQEVIYRVLGGTNLEAFDLDVTTTSGDPICVSVATSTVLSEHGAAILSFRDVTAERALETELRKTKEFLEKLIDGAVDAIIAADVEGNVILYNPGAERLYGWRPEDVIGRMSVEKMYPEGVARQIMRMLRSPSYGGVGRLELTRREIVTKDGEVVPVNMTASIIYEDGREVATVGILSDLRDRIRIEQRLLRAQEKLVITEKQALVAELAGAAAHELNQPLTSVMGYAELLRKKMAPDDPHWRAVDIILREAGRMADIVKKIGKITRYETKAYVGSAQILDLERSSGREEPPSTSPAPTDDDGEPKRAGGQE